MTRIGSQGNVEVNDVTDVMSLSLILYSFPVFRTFLKGEKQILDSHFLGDISLKFTIVVVVVVFFFKLFVFKFFF